MTQTGKLDIDEEPRLGAWRSDTPGCTERIHLNNAGAALMPRKVSDAIHEHVDLESRVGGYEASDNQRDAIDSVYDEVAKLVDAEPRNMAIVGSATAAFIQAITSFDFAPGDVIVTSKSDYTSYQIQYLALSKRAGVRIVHAQDLPEGGIDPDSLRKILEIEKCKLVSVSWMPTHSGLIQDAAAVGRVCEEAGVPFHLDACQAAGQVTINAKELRCDYLSATGRKFLRGPRGIGFLYASDRALERGDYPLFVDMRGAEWISPSDFTVAESAKRYEGWEFAYALVLGMGAAARYANEQGIAGTGLRARSLAGYLRHRLAEIPGIRVLDPGSSKSAIVTFDHDRVRASELVNTLKRERINTVASQRWYGLLDFSERGVEAAVRASPHYYNSIAEIELLADTIREAVSG